MKGAWQESKVSRKEKKRAVTRARGNDRRAKEESHFVGEGGDDAGVEAKCEVALPLDKLTISMFRKQLAAVEKGRV